MIKRESLFREPDGTVYFSLEGRNGYGLKNKDAFNREGQCCTLAGVFRQEGKRGIMDAGSVDFSHPMELQLHHKAPVKIIYHAEIAGDEIHITQEEKETSCHQPDAGAVPGRKSSRQRKEGRLRSPESS